MQRLTRPANSDVVALGPASPQGERPVGAEYGVKSGGQVCNSTP